MQSWIRWPILLVIGRKSRLWLVGFVGLVVILGSLGVTLIVFDSHAYRRSQGSLPVNAPLKDPAILFEVETIKPNNLGGNYFVNYRLNREQFRQETKSMLSELLDSTVDKTKAQAQQKWLELSSKIQKEEEIENLLKIKGFQDAVADVFSEHVAVIVYAPSLNPKEVSLIQDTVLRVTNIRLDKVTISTKN